MIFCLHEKALKTWLLSTRWSTRSACIMSNIQSYSHWISCVNWPSLFKWSMFSIVQNFILWSCSLLTQLVDDESDVDTILTEESFVRYFFSNQTVSDSSCADFRYRKRDSCASASKRIGLCCGTIAYLLRYSLPFHASTLLWWLVTFDFRFDRTHLRPDPLELLSTVLLTLSSQSHFQVSLPKLRVVYFDFFLSVPFPTARWVTSTVSALTEQPNLSSINVSSVFYWQSHKHWPVNQRMWFCIFSVVRRCPWFITFPAGSLQLILWLPTPPAEEVLKTIWPIVTVETLGQLVVICFT